jgi:AcrR family transcriptional regulator
MSSKSPTTEARILDVATEVFLEVGYQRATFREICRRASANTAAINYHFRDKEGLYREVLERVIAEHHRQWDTQASPPTDQPENKLRVLVRIMVDDLLGPQGSTPLLRLVASEMANPTAGLGLVVEKVIRPFDERLGCVIHELLGPDTSAQRIHDCVQSVVAQCNHLHVAQAVISRLGQYPAYDAEAVEHLIDHITQFSLGGIRAMRADRQSVGHA